MTLTGVSLTELDGGVQILPPNIGENIAIIGNSTTGTVNLAGAYGGVSAIRAEFGAGALVELGCYVTALTGKPVTLVRSTSTNAGTAGTVDRSNVVGTSVVTVSGAPVDEYEGYIIVVTGGIIGTTGITLKYSLDNGRTLSAETALGVATSFTIPNSGLTFDFGSGNLLAGDYAFTRTVPPTTNAIDMVAALEALRTTQLTWDYLCMAECTDGDGVAALDTWCITLAAQGKPRWAMCNLRGPNVSESEAAYASSLGTAIASYSSTHVSAWGGYARTISQVNGARYRRPACWPVAVRCGATVVSSVGISPAKVKLGPLTSDVQLYDQNGNNVEHDEALNPGLDAIRLGSLRTRLGSNGAVLGTYIEKPRILCAVGSDYQEIQLRKVMNQAEKILVPLLNQLIEDNLRCDKKTGYLKKEDCAAIEVACNAALASGLLSVPDASDAYLVVPRNQNVLSTRTVATECRIVSLAYPWYVTLSIGFTNPANNVQGV